MEHFKSILFHKSGSASKQHTYESVLHISDVKYSIDRRMDMNQRPSSRETCALLTPVVAHLLLPLRILTPTLFIFINPWFIHLRPRKVAVVPMSSEIFPEGNSDTCAVVIHCVIRTTTAYLHILAEFNYRNFIIY